MKLQPAVKNEINVLFDAFQQLLQQASINDFFAWHPRKELIGIGASGKIAYDYSGKVLPITSFTDLAGRKLDACYTGVAYPSFISGAGMAFQTWSSYLEEKILEKIAALNPYTDLNEEKAEKWLLDVECLVAELLDGLLLSDFDVRFTIKRRL